MRDENTIILSFRFVRLIMKNKKLFIFIPTYSRSEYLEKQLINISKDLFEFRDRIRVIVSWNYDGGGQYDLFKKKYSNPNIEFRENVGNIGGNANIMLGFVFAKRDEYLWILSDDDLVLEGAVSEIFKELSNNYSLYHIGDYNFKFNSQLSIENVFTVTKGAGFGLISSTIYDVNKFCNYFKVGFDYIESSFPHLAILLSHLNDNKNINFGGIVHSKIFTGIELPSHGTGDYSISATGFGYLGDFLQTSERKSFVRGWLFTGYSLFFSARKSNKYYFYKALGYYIIRDPLLIFIFCGLFFRIIKDKIIRIIHNE
jgi:hypothetical protein